MADPKRSSHEEQEKLSPQQLEEVTFISRTWTDDKPTLERVEKLKEKAH